MNDRFKFRAWDKEEKIMVYCWSEATEEQKEKYCDIYGKDEVYNCWQSCQLCCLEDYDERFIIEQCTGLKDKNGKLIYDDDVIKINDELYRVAIDDFGCRTVILNNNPFTEVIEWSDIVKQYYFYNREDEIEVIGNIYKNADLLGEE